MKKLTLICSTVLLGFGLAGCGNQDKHSDTHSKAKTEKVKKNSKSKKSSSSSSSSSMSSSSSIASSTVATSSSQTVTTQSSSVQQQSNSNQQDAQGEPQTLTEFVNKYGMSPAAYKMQYEGMSELEALQSTPDNMKTSGEIQLQHQLEQQER